MRICLTGASGFIGSHLLSELAEHDVVTLTRREMTTSVNVKNVVGELDDETVIAAAFEGCDAVIHLAALSSAVVAAQDPIECVETNVVATARLAHLAKSAGVERFVFASSGLVYGQPSELPITEHTPLAPTGVYPASKAAAERLIEALHPHVATIRIFNTYGARQVGTLVPVLIDKMQRGEHITLQGDGSQIRSFLYVADAVEAIRLLTESDATGLFNLAGWPASILDVYHAIAEALGTNTAPEFSPARIGDPQENWATCERFADELRWRPITSLRDGIALTVADAVPS
jgi:UDP-glucose 4-epimerase